LEWPYQEGKIILSTYNFKTFFFLVGFLLCSTFVSLIWNFSFSPHFLASKKLDVKVELFLKHKDDYDYVFIGTSSAYRGISPKVFDAEFDRLSLAAGDSEVLPIKSFNFSPVNLSYSELLKILEVIYVAKPRKLKKIIFEPIVHSVIDARNVRNMRKIQSLTFSSFKMELWILLYSDRELVEKIRLGSRILRVFLYQMINYDKLGFILRRFIFEGDQVKSNLRVDPNFDGFVPIDDSETEATEQRKRFLETMEHFLERVRHANLSPIGELSRSEMEALKEIGNRVHSVGASAVILLSPNIYDELYRKLSKPNTKQLGEFCILAFNDPLKDPDLFNPAYRWDQMHLNIKGAEIFSRALANRFWHNCR
jgi:hypothetical protein